MRDHSKSAKRFLPTANVVNQESFIRVENAQNELWVTRGDYVRDTLLGALGKVVSENLYAVSDG